MRYSNLWEYLPLTCLHRVGPIYMGLAYALKHEAICPLLTSSLVLEYFFSTVNVLIAEAVEDV